MNKSGMIKVGTRCLPQCRRCQLSPAAGGVRGLCLDCFKHERDEMLEVLKAVTTFFRPKGDYPADVMESWQKMFDRDPILERVRAVLEKAKKWEIEKPQKCNPEYDLYEALDRADHDHNSHNA